MAKDISQKNTINIWGVQSDGSISNVLEPQRSDLFLVDLNTAARQIQAVANVAVPEQLPQFVASVAFPEVSIKADPFSRESIPYNMPSTDDPVGQLKITFLTDTWEASDRCDTVQLLDIWIALVRAGRGARYGGFNTSGNFGYFALDSNFQASCKFDINISLCRGKVPLDPVSLAQINNQGTASVDMREHTKWIARRCWCSGYKLADLGYGECKLMTIDASFYPEAIERATPLQISGSPLPVVAKDQ